MKRLYCFIHSLKPIGYYYARILITNFKNILVMTNNEKSWLKFTAAIIKEIVERRKYSKATLDIAPDDAWFKESCNFIGLICDLQDFAATLENVVKYAEMSEKNEAPLLLHPVRH